MRTFKKWLAIFGNTLEEFGTDNATKLSASLAYYTLFAIGPMILLIVSGLGLIIEKERITTEIYQQLVVLLGKSGADFILGITQNMQQQNAAAKFGLIGTVVLIFGASGLFVEIQTSINYIWSIRAKPKRSWLKFIQDRFFSFLLVIGMGLLLIVVLFVNTLADLFADRISAFFGADNLFLLQAVNFGLLFTVTTLLFTVIYKVLPDAHIYLRDALVGAAFTSVLFLLGRFLIGLYLGKSSFSSTYGAAASVIIVLTWVYYSSLILYFGAEFTKVYTLSMGRGITPYKTAVYILKQEAIPLKTTDTTVHPEQAKADIHLHNPLAPGARHAEQHRRADDPQRENAEQGDPA